MTGIEWVFTGCCILATILLALWLGVPELTDYLRTRRSRQ